MSDVRETAAPAARNDNGPNPAGDFIWYELMTTDADGAKTFYDAVAGISDLPPAASIDANDLSTSGT